MKAMAARLARGEEAAFAELYDACANRLHSYLTARLDSRDRAAEVVQEAFLRAVASRRRFAKVENPIICWRKTTMGLYWISIRFVTRRERG
jgi:RNA polymerase sigma-70 factor (ECF subfamily)